MFAQDCPAGYKCTYRDQLEPQTLCVPVTGLQHAGDPCTWQGEGIVGPDAWSMMPFAGECALQCTGSPDGPMCPEGQVCELWGQGGPWTCETPCDPLAPNCEDGHGCHWDYYYFYCMPVIGDVPTGSPCSHVTECSPGNFCVDANALLDCAGDACCTSFCALDLGDADCAAQPGTNCVSLFEPERAPPLYANLGVCVIP